MKRYTKKNGRNDNEWAIFMSDGVAQIWSHESNIRFEGAPIDRLAAYEDTGLLPEEIRDMEWISVKDRLPDSGVDVIALTDSGNVARISRTSTDGGYWVGRGGFLVIPDITHWMPLPAPPTP